MADENDQPPVYGVSSDDPAMRAAIEQARATFGDFLRELEADSRRVIPALATTLVKGYFSDDDAPSDGEHMWVEVQDWNGNSVTGILLSQPGHVKSVRVGDTVRVPRERLSDWLYDSDGTARGAFTVQVLRRRMSPAERREHDAHYPFAFEEA